MICDMEDVDNVVARILNLGIEIFGCCRVDDFRVGGTLRELAPQRVQQYFLKFNIILRKDYSLK